MEEVCIVVDRNDEPLRAGSKKECHLMANISQGLLHRAFSLFIFNPTTHKLLLQQRSLEKITFPEMWTNSCCSHPLHIEKEVGEWTDGSSVQGAKVAARRKVQHELGIELDDDTAAKIEFLTRIHYGAPSGGLWGEHEIDYILFLVADVDVVENKNEVMASCYVDQSELMDMLDNKGRCYLQLIELTFRPQVYAMVSTRL